ncbi:hypothetical protein BU17DRAFT_91050 [Hysterangium stoloniferum]|nr:hypothetical protein BU17DRAFT_91050 [Hysterangium stoloniferum]
MLVVCILVIVSMALSVLGKVITINVGANATNGTGVFDPQRVDAFSGDVVVFRFINGTNSVVQSDFASPCIPISQTNSSINGFNSGLRPPTAISTELSVTIDGSNNATAMWFFDSVNGTCGAGAVGVINSNETSQENLPAFIRNAMRLNGTAKAASTIAATFTGAPTQNSPLATGISDSNGDIGTLVPIFAAGVMGAVGLAILS